MDKDKVYTFEELKDIIRTLRGENGCPWDRAQTHESLIPCMLEEADEVVQGIHILTETKDWENLCEELGDVLLQVLLHSQIAEEEGLFTLDDVIQGLSEKMIRRHPHVFGNADAQSPEAALLSWEEVKRREKEERAARRKVVSTGENP
ncbi:MAG: MazG family protein [Lachnospiraceae bacterium]|jgi:tetrapyrrole methylase family protein/MazG family protein